MSQQTVSRWLSSAVGTGALLPMTLKGAVNKDWRASLPERFGRGGWPDAVRQVGPGAAWFHAASVGEVGGLVPVIDALNAQSLFQRRLITTTSLTGRCEVLRRKICTRALLLPFDQPAISGRLVHQLQPAICVINETEIWPNLLFALKACSTPVVIINGRLSDKSFPLYRRIRYFIEPALDAVNFVLAQTELDAERFRALGAAEEKVQVAGSTKYDRGKVCFSEDELNEYANALGLLGEKPIFVGGSVRPGEDDMVVEAYCKMRRSAPEAQLILAPRHPEQFDRAAELLDRAGLIYNRRSKGTVSAMAPVVLLDTVGELSKAYALASTAFIGGSIVDFGGHNPLEPAAYSKPVLMGPHSSNVREVAQDMERTGALIRVNSVDEITYAALRFCTDADSRVAAGNAAQQIWLKHQGATDRVVSLLKEMSVEADNEPEPLRAEQSAQAGR